MIGVYIVLVLLSVADICFMYFLYKSDKEKKRLENDLDNKITEYEKLKNVSVKYKEYLDGEFENAKESLKIYYDEQLEKKANEIAKEYEDSITLGSEELENKISQLDKELGNKIKEISDKNTLYFTCPCDGNKHQIPCLIDFTKENNYFTCERCGSVYRVELSAIPILMSGMSSMSSKLASLFEENGKEQ